jgi:two-component system, OmpR family, response regulator
MINRFIMNAYRAPRRARPAPVLWSLGAKGHIDEMNLPRWGDAVETADDREVSMRVLVIEGEVESSGWICATLVAAGFEARSVAPAAALRELGRAMPALVVVDLSLPGPDGQDGFAVVEAARGAEPRVPVIILSALGHADERVRGRRAGADLFLTKPLAAAELAMRVRGLVVGRTAAPPPAVLRCGDLSMDLETRRVLRAGKTIELKPDEFRMLEQLLLHKDEVVTRGMLLETVWNYRFDPHASLIETHVSRLRRKIDGGFSLPLLHTRRGVGYKLSETP